MQTTAVTEPLRERRTRTSFYATVGCVSVIVGLLLGVGGFFGVRALQGDGGITIGEGEETTAPEEEPQVLDEAPVGPDAAVPFGSTFPTVSGQFEGEAEVTFAALDWDATDEIHEANSYNEDPGEGQKYILLAVDGVYRGEGTLSPLGGGWISVTYVAEDGAEHPRVWVVTPRYSEEAQQAEISDGDSFFVEFPMVVPETIEGGGHIVLTQSGQALDEGIWVHAD